MTYYTVFYVLFFSLIAHKEIRFLMPIIPFIMICSGEYLAQLLKRKPNFTSFLVKIYIIVEIIAFGVFHAYI